MPLFKNLTSRVVVSFSFLAIGIFGCSCSGEAQESLSSITFITSPRWYVLKRIALDGETLTFRKYSFSLIDGKMTDAEKTKNIYDFGCQRNSRYSDYLIFHFPNWAISGLEASKWIPRLHLNVALDDYRITFDAEAEYKNNSLFVDLDGQQLDNLLKLIAAKDIVIDYGVKETRLRIFQTARTPDGKGDVEGFIDDFVKQVVSPAMNFGKVTSFDTKSMFDACLAYKRRGRLP